MPTTRSRRRGTLLGAAALALTTAPLGAQGPGTAHPVATPSTRIVPLTAPVSVDGRLAEEVWRTAPPATDFRQLDPREGEPATQRTEVRFAYDAEALYVGARMHDSLGAAGVRTRLGRRDQSVDSDWLTLVLDTFHDHTGRTIFQVNPSGVKQDAGQAAPSVDPAWDPVWEAATRVDSLGWTAELRIPFSQLRFPKDSVQTWGVQIWRSVQRLNEVDMWSFWGKQEAGGPPRFGHLEGLRLERRPRGVELLPYLVGRASHVAPFQPGSPFESPREYTGRAGLDLKALLTSELTLDATLNPDFGQVEVDPAVVNLSAFETFFQEKRPFFVEGSGLFRFGGFNCFFCSNVSSMSLFYSRRIGRRPQGVIGGPARYADTPDNTSILGAAKITGRTAGGVQVGVLSAVTGAERARILDPTGARTDHEVEPFANYLVGRVKRNARDGNLTLGAIGTSLVRRFGDSSQERFLSRHAESAGADWELWWGKRTYHLMGNFALSQVSGEPEAIRRLQLSSARYFQRPDREPGSGGLFTDGYDPALTTMRGYGGYLRLAKATGSTIWESALNVRSPGFEVNDVAFLTQADYVWMNATLGRQWTRPTRRYRRLDLMGGFQQQYNFDGDLTGRQFHAFAGGQLPNYWHLNSFVIVRPEVLDDRMTRGGPVVGRPGDWTAFLNLSTDSRRAVVIGSNPRFGRNADGAPDASVNLDVRYKPASNLEVSVGPALRRARADAQYVRRFDDPAATHFHGQRVVFADLVQHTASMDTRLNVTFRPTLTLELFMQPLVATGDYQRFKEFEAPRTSRKRIFEGARLRAVRDAGGRDSVYLLDADADPSTPALTFANPDFNLRSLRGNAVLRWEYRPGSTLFLVWQQQRSGSVLAPGFDLARDAPGVFRQRPDNIFLVKMSYWFGR